MAKILIADDERRILELMERVLEKRGHEVETFADGASAVDAIEAGGEYDLVITDLRMPGKTGLEVLEASKARRPRAPVLLVTGATEPEDRARAEALGVYMVLHKPVDLAYLMTLVDAALERETLGRKVPAPQGARPQGATVERPVITHPAASHPAPAPQAAPPPAPVPASAPAPVSAAPATAAPPVVRVRVVERDACLENMIAYCLRKQGCRVSTGPGAGAADVAIVGLVGAIEGVRRDAPGAVIVALYPGDSQEEAVRVLDAGADVALPRPIDPDMLLAHVRAAGRRARPASHVDHVSNVNHASHASHATHADHAHHVDHAGHAGGAAERPITRNRLAAVRN